MKRDRRDGRGHHRRARQVDLIRHRRSRRIPRLGKHDVAVPVRQFKLNDGKLVLAGATADALKAMPAFEYSKRT